jgi:hypothetical protein
LKVNIAQETILTDISDHHALTLEISNLSNFHEQPINVIKRFFSNENIEYFCSLLQRENWYNVYAEINAENSFTAFYDTFLTHFENAFPKMKSTIKFKTKKPTYNTEKVKKN